MWTGAFDRRFALDHGALRASLLRSGVNRRLAERQKREGQ
jgi:hypothetical protein